MNKKTNLSLENTAAEWAGEEKIGIDFDTETLEIYRKGQNTPLTIDLKKHQTETLKEIVQTIPNFTPENMKRRLPLLWWSNERHEEYLITIAKIPYAEHTIGEMFSLIKNPKLTNTINDLLNGLSCQFKNGYIAAYHTTEGTLDGIRLSINGQNYVWYPREEKCRGYLISSKTEGVRDSYEKPENIYKLIYELILFWKDENTKTEHETIALLNDIKTIPEDQLRSILQNRDNHPDLEAMHTILNKLMKKEK